MLPTSKYLLVAFAAMTAAGFAGCGNTTYEIHPDPSSIGGTSAAQDSSEVVPAADNNDETLAKIKELEANIDELNRKLAADGNPSPSEMPQSDPETDAGGTIDNSAPKPPVEGSTQLDATDTVAYADSLDPLDPAPKVEAKKDIVLTVTPPTQDPPKVEAAKEILVEANPPPPPPPEGSVYYAGSDDQPPWKRAQ